MQCAVPLVAQACEHKHWPVKYLEHPQDLNHSHKHTSFSSKLKSVPVCCIKTTVVALI